MRRNAIARSLLCSLALVGADVPAASAQALPGEPYIVSATDQLNSITPQAVPRQTITIGSYNEATGKFTWILPGSFPPGTPIFKEEGHGGTEQPQHVAPINSYDVTYKFYVVNAQPHFSLTLSLPNGHGGTQDVTASAANGVAYVAFHPQSFGQQIARFPKTQVAITPHLQPQLGAFVVPDQLIGIVYQPPGMDSAATYTNTSTFGSTVTWSFESSSGFVETQNPAAFDEFFRNTLLPGAVGLASPVAGQVAGVLGMLASDPVETITSMTTNGMSNSLGSTFSLTQGVSTVNDQYAYPWKGDVFVILRDVLYAYVVENGRVVLSPLAYAGVQPLFGGDLSKALPAQVAARFLALDPLAPGNRVSVKTRPQIPAGSLSRGFGPPRFVLSTTWQCVPVAQTVMLDQAQFQSSGVSQTTSQTVVEHQTGLMSSIAGAPDTLWGYTQSTSATQLTGQGTSAGITLQCPASEGEYAVPIYYDTLYRTFLALKGTALARQPELSGTVSKPNGTPAPGEPVTLALGGRKYVVTSDSQGNFAFRFAGLPRGPATLEAGNISARVQLRGARLRGLKLKLR